MKKIFIMVGIILIVALVGLALVACSGGDLTVNINDETGEVMITPNDSSNDGGKQHGGESTTSDPNDLDSDNSGVSTTEGGSGTHLHQYSDEQVILMPTCTECGKKKKICSCGAEVEEDIAPIGHKGNWVVIREPNCMGGEQQMICSVCTMAVTEELPPDFTKHSWFGDSCALCHEHVASQGLRYSILSETTVEVTGYSGNDLIVYLPTSYAGRVITSIKNDAFSEMSKDFSLIIPRSVAILGDSLFSNCVHLKSINIPSSVTSIENEAFKGCTGLTEITITDSITSVGQDVFSGCSSLTEIYYQGDFSKWCEMSYLHFLLNEKSNFYLNGAKPAGNWSIPNGVTAIPAYAFNNCMELTSITIPDSVTSIGESAFSGCSSLESMTIPFVGGSMSAKSANNTTVLGYVFGASSYEGGSAITQYYHKKYSSTYYIPATLRSVAVTGGNIRYGAFYNCGMLTSIEISDGVESIGESAFSGCSSLRNITIPFVGGSKSVTAASSSKVLGYIFGEECYTDGIEVTSPYEVGGATYYIPSNLRSVTVTGGEILYGAFYGCSMLTSVTIPDNVTSIGDFAFWNCSSLTSITIPESVTSIGNAAFCNGSGLTTIYYMGDVAGWCGLSGLNGLSRGRTFSLYIDGRRVAGDFVIPDNVTSIGAYAFCNCTDLTSVTIPEGVTSIGERAFASCSGLTSVTILNAETNYGEYVFEKCPIESATVPTGAPISKGNLKTVVFNGGTSIGKYAFYGCSSLTSVTIPEGVTSIGKYAFNNCNKLSYNYNGNAFGAYLGNSENPYVALIRVNENSKFVILHENTKCIADKAFYGCTDLTSVTIPEGVTSIGEDAFYGCSGLTSVTIPEGLTSIGSNAFYGCRGLTSVTIPEGVTSIGEYAFRGCSGLTSITIADGNRIYHSSGNCLIETNSKSLILGCKSSVIPSDGSVITITEGAFGGCSGLTSVTIPNSVTSIGYGAFSGCSGLTSITIPNSVTSIGTAAFKGSGLTSVAFAEGSQLTTISEHMFSDCSQLATITIPESVTSIGEWAFYYSGLRSIRIPDSVKSIARYAFQYCSSLTSVTIGSGVTDVGDASFSECSGLSSVTFAEGSQLTTIAAGMFFRCTRLSTITIPDSVTSIGSQAFMKCSGLTSVTIGSGVKTIEGCAFDSCSGLTSIMIPESLTRIKEKAFRICNYLSSITFQGTIEQWLAIEKTTGWDDYAGYYVGKYTVHCSDGDI